jgi:predicted porin
MLQNETILTQPGDSNTAGSLKKEGTSFQRAYLEGRLGGTHVTAGRQDFTIVDGNLYDTRMDGVKVEYGNKVKLGAYYGRPTDEDYQGAFDYNKFWGVNAAAKMGGFGLTAGYDKFTNSDYDFDDNGVWNVGAKYDFGKASLGAIYMKSNFDVADDTTNKAIIVTGTILWVLKLQNQVLGVCGLSTTTKVMGLLLLIL